MSAQEFRVLVVMDAPNDRKMIAKVLTEVFKVKQVMQTHTPANAFNMIKSSETIHLVIFDLDLPKVDGLAFMKKAKTLGATRQAAFIMTSIRKERDILIKAVAAGVKDFILRPVNPENLKQRLHKFFQKNQSKLRETKRVALFESYKAQINFSEKGQYKGHILDLSLGGCQIRTPVFNKSRQTIYDKAEILIAPLAPITIKAELVRLETDAESDSGDKDRTMKAAFKFVEMDNGVMHQLSELLKDPESAARKIEHNEKKKSTKATKSPATAKAEKPRPSPDKNNDQAA